MNARNVQRKIKIKPEKDKQEKYYQQFNIDERKGSNEK